MRTAIWQGRAGKIVQESVGRVLVDFGDRQQWIIKDIPGLTICERSGRGRPRKHTNDADKQKAYRERKKQERTEALRKSEEAKAGVIALAAKVDEWSALYDQHQARFLEYSADDVPKWSAEVNRLCNCWWESHGEWYTAWLAIDAPKDAKPKSSKW